MRRPNKFTRRHWTRDGQGVGSREGGSWGSATQTASKDCDEVTENGRHEMQMKLRQTLTLALALPFLLCLSLTLSLPLSRSFLVCLALSLSVCPHLSSSCVAYGSLLHFAWRSMAHPHQLAGSACNMPHATCDNCKACSKPHSTPCLPPSLHNCQPMFAVVVVAVANPRLLHTDTCVKPHCQRAICRPSAGRVDRQYLP